MAEPVALQSCNPDRPMHLFDIRRSNSVTDLWKGYQYSEPSREAWKQPSLDTELRTSESESLLEAFEAEMAKIMESPSSGREGKRQSDPDEQSSSAVGEARKEPESTSPGNRSPNSTDVLTSALQSLMGNAEAVRSELSSRLPDLEQQLRNVQQAIPQTIPESLEPALTALGSQVDSALAGAFSRISGSLGQTSSPRSGGNGTSPQYSMEGLQNAAFEVSQICRTVFDGLNSGFARNTSNREETGKKKQPDEPAPERQEQRVDATSPFVSRSADSLSPEKKVSADNSTEAIAKSTDHSGSQHEAGHSGRLPDTNQRKTNEWALSGMFGCEQGSPSEPQSSTASSRTKEADACRKCAGSSRPLGQTSDPNEMDQQLSSLFSDCSRRQGAPTSFGLSHVPPMPRQVRPMPHQVLCDSSRSTVKPLPSLFAASPFQSHSARLDDMQVRLPSGSDPAVNSSDRTLFVGNVGFNVTREMIRGVCASKGFLVDVDLPLDVETQRHVGFGYLQFA